MRDTFSKSWTVSRIAMGALFTLAAVSVAGAYLARREMETQSYEHSQRWQAMKGRLTLRHALLDQASAAVTHSRERVGQIGVLGLAPGSSAQRATKERWHNASVGGWDAAADDLILLSQSSPGSSAMAQTLLQTVEELLEAEILVWRQIDGFVERKGVRLSDEDASQKIRHTLKEYHEREKAYADALSKVGVELSRKELQGNAELERFTEGALEGSRTKLLWSGLGLAASSFGLPCYGLSVCLFKGDSKPPGKTTLLVNRTSL